MIVLSALVLFVGTILVEESKVFITLVTDVEAYTPPTEEVIEEEPKEVRVAVIFNWNEERIIEEINKVFPDAPTMVRVAKCESTYQADAFNPTNGSDDKGLFQISTHYHGEEVAALGLDMYDIKDNLAFARILYDRHGLQPWSASRTCWNK